jgi:hypothetical protein
MKATLAPLAGIVSAALLAPVLTGCGANAQAESPTEQPLIASGGSALHVEREPRLASRPNAFGAAHVNSEPLAGLVLFFAMRAQQARQSEHLTASGPPCDLQRPGSVARAPRRSQAHRRESGCSHTG